MMGPPNYPDHPIPTWKEFCLDYLPYYFDDSLPTLAGVLSSLLSKKIFSYNKINQKKKETELDIWLCSEAYCGKGYGSDALETLCKYLHDRYGVKRFIIRPSSRNKRAIAAYKKAGFEPLPITMEKHIAEYGPPDVKDAIILTKQV